LKIKDGMPDGAASASDADDDKTKFTTTYKDNKITE